LGQARIYEQSKPPARQQNPFARKEINPSMGEAGEAYSTGPGPPKQKQKPLLKRGQTRNLKN